MGMPVDLVCNEHCQRRTRYNAVLAIYFTVKGIYRIVENLGGGKLRQMQKQAKWQKTLMNVPTTVYWRLKLWRIESMHTILNTP